MDGVPWTRSARARLGQTVTLRYQWPNYFFFSLFSYIPASVRPNVTQMMSFQNPWPIAGTVFSHLTVPVFLKRPWSNQKQPTLGQSLVNTTDEVCIASLLFVSGFFFAFNSPI